MRKIHTLGVHNNARQLMILQNKFNIEYDSIMNLTRIMREIRQTAEQRLKIKRMVISLHLEYCTRLALAKEETGEVKAATYIRSLCQIEAVRKKLKT